MPLRGRGIPQGPEDGLHHREAAIRDGAGVAADDRPVIGGGRDADENAAGVSATGRGHAPGDGGGGYAVRGHPADVALPAAACGNDREGILHGAGPLGRPHEPQTRRSSWLAGPVAWLDETPIHAGRCRRRTPPPKNMRGNLRLTPTGSPALAFYRVVDFLP